MIRKIKKAAAILSVAAAASAALGGLSAGAVSAANTYTPVSGSSVANPGFQKYLIMRAGDTTPQVIFHYSISAGNARSLNTAENGVMEVRQGIQAENITVSDAVFQVGQQTSSTAEASRIDLKRNDRANILFESEKGEKYAVSGSTVDCSRVSFTEPGIYRYIITETVSQEDQARGIIPDDDTDRVLDVYVVDNGNGGLSISAYVLHRNDADVRINGTMGSGDVTSAGTALSDKTDGFTSEYESTDLVFTNSVTGNQASRDKYFQYSLQLTGLRNGDRFDVSLAPDTNAFTTDGSADRSIQAYPNDATTAITSNVAQPSVITASSGGTITQTYYLQDGQSIAVRGLPANVKYALTENAEDYKPAEAAVEGYTNPVSSGNNNISSVDQDHDKLVKTSYLNQRAGAVPTGVMVSVGPGLLMLLVGAGGFAVSRIHSSGKKGRGRKTGRQAGK